MIKISDRLRMIAEMVTPCGVAADIGCDHCLTLIYLIEKGLCERGIGSDIKRGPLEKARDNINSLGFSDRIELRLGTGLSTLAQAETEALIISGMGGGLMSKIISEGALIAESAKELILQPQSEIGLFRKNLHLSGFAITEEKMLFEQGKYYNIIKAVKGEEKYEKEAYYLYGKILIHKKDPLLAEYLRERLAENENIAETLTGGRTENCGLRLAELENVNSIIREVLAWL